MERMRQWMDYLVSNIHLCLGDGHFQCVFRSDTIHTPSRGDAYGGPCRKDARRIGVW